MSGDVRLTDAERSLWIVLVVHRLHASMNTCIGCDWRATQNAGSLADQHAAHLARVIAARAAEAPAPTDTPPGLPDAAHQPSTTSAEHAGGADQAVRSAAGPGGAPAPTDERDVRLTDAEWAEFQAIPDQGYSHRDWLDKRFAAKYAALSPTATDAREALARVEAVAAAWESDRDVCLRWIADPTMHVDPDHPARLSRMADLLNRHAESVRAAAALSPTAPDAGPRCDACDDTGRVPWMIEADPSCSQERDSDGMVPCPDCAPTDAREALAASFDQRADAERAIWQRSIHPERGEAQEREAVWRVAARDVRAALAPAPTDAREALDDSQVPGPLLFLVREVRAERDAAREALARVETAARPLIKYLNGMDAFYSDEPYDTEDVIDTASGDRGDTAALRWSDLRDLRAALSPTAPDAGQRDTQERRVRAEVALCAKCGYGSTEHGMTGHPAALCVAEMHIVPAAYYRADREAQP